MSSTPNALKSARLANSPARRRPLVGLTPLIDVVFILLLFFMLASSFLDLHSIALDAPSRGGGQPTMEGALLVEVRRDGIRLGGQYVTPQGLAQRVAARLEDNPDRRVLVRPAEGVSLQDTVSVLDRLTASGARNLSMLGDDGPR